MSNNPNLVAGDAEGNPLEDTDHLVNGRVPGEGSGLLTETDDGAVTPIDGKPFHTEKAGIENARITERPYPLHSRYLNQGHHAGRPLVHNFDEEVFSDWWGADDGSVSPDASDSFRGPSSALVESTDTENPDFSYWDGESLDLEGLSPTIAIKVDEPNELNRTRVELESYDPTGRARFEQTHPTGAPDGTWYRMDLSATQIQEDFNFSDVEEINIRAAQRSGEVTRARVDDLRFVETGDKPRVMLTFDDGLDSHYSEAFPILEKYGIPGAFAVVTGWVGDSGNLTEEQILEMDSKGHEIINHTKDHYDLDDLSESEVREQIRDARVWLQDRGLTREGDTLIYVGGRYDETVLDVTSEYCELAMSVETDDPSRAASPLTLTSPFTVMRADADTNAGADMADVENAIDMCEQSNQVLPLFFHAVRDDGDVTPADLEHICEYITDKGIEVITPSDWIAELGHRTA